MPATPAEAVAMQVLAQPPAACSRPDVEPVSAMKPAEAAVVSDTSHRAGKRQMLYGRRHKPTGRSVRVYRNGVRSVMIDGEQQLPVGGK
jgi:hypothetical protein